jgi:stage V sporulation protein B
MSPKPKKSLLTSALFIVAAQAVVLILGWITHPIIGRFLGPAAYGVYGVVLSLQTIVGLLLTLGIPMAISRFVAQDHDHAHSILYQAARLQLLLAVIAAGATVLFSPVFASLLGDSSLVPYIRMVSLILLFQASYPLFTQYLGGLHYFGRQAALTVIYAVAKLVGAVGLFFIFHLYGVLAGFAIGGLVASIIGWFWIRDAGGYQRRQLPIKAFISFAGMYVIILIGLQILISLDLFMVKALLKDDTSTGYYNAAVNLSRISYFLLQSLSFIILPSVSALTKPGQSHDKAVAFIRDVLRYLIALIVPAAVFAAATSRPLILLFFSRQYLPAAPMLTVLMIGLGSMAFYLLLINIVAGAGKAKVGLGLTFSMVALSAILGAILIPRFGLLGAAWQTTITGLIGLTVLTIYLTRTFGIKLPVKSTINVLLATAIAVLPTYFWEASAVLLPVQYLLLGTLYLGALIVLGEVTAEDRAHLSRMHPALRRLAP